MTLSISWRRGFSASALWLLLLLAGTVWAQEQNTEPAVPLRLNELKFEGLQRYELNSIIAITELKVGEKIDLAAIKAATRRLTLTGYFGKVAYRYAFDEEKIDVLFIVEERALPEGVLCVFDNFVWFSDQEIREAIRREIPYFEGKAPQSDVVIGKIKTALEALLKSRSLPSQVDYLVNEGSTTFMVRGATFPICSVRFTGNAAVAESDLTQAAQGLLGTEYSRQFVPSYVAANLIPVYRKRGFLRVRFTFPQVSLDTTTRSCKNGISLPMSVQEGLTYSWEKAQWTGNQVMSSEALDKLLGLKNGDVADGLKIDNGMNAILRAYGKQGYVQVKLNPVSQFDDAGRRVTYQISLNEGQQFRMGQVIFSGLPEADIKKLRDKWKLKTGDVYDALYLDEFMKSYYEGKLGVGAKALAISPRVQADPQMLVVNVTLAFK